MPNMELEDDELTEIGTDLQSHVTKGELSQDLRMFRSRNGELVRVLDGLNTPLSSSLLCAIDSYVDSQRTAGKIQNAANRGMSTEPTCFTINKTTHKTGNGKTSTDKDDNSKAEDNAEVVNQGASLSATPLSLLAQGVRVSLWLNGETEVEDEQSNSRCEVSSNHFEGPQRFNLEGHIQEWPKELQRRTEICHTLLPNCHTYSGQSCVLYWLRNTFVVRHGNYGLQAAQILADSLHIPVIAMTLVPSSILLPIRHATTANEAFTRTSLAESKRELKELGIELYTFCPMDSTKHSTAPPSSTSAGIGLVELFNVFTPVTIVVDNGFAATTRHELDCVIDTIQERRQNSVQWSILAVDSSSCLPFHSASKPIATSLSMKEGECVSEHQFAIEYMTMWNEQDTTSLLLQSPHHQHHHWLLPRVDALNKTLDTILLKLGLERVQWDIVESMDDQSLPGEKYTESTAISRLESLLKAADTRPAIQQELQGDGIVSLLPYIRHGTLSARYVLHRLDMTIAETPKPTDAISRKANALLKVLRSRAFVHLGRERDYALYQSSWAYSRLYHSTLTNRALTTSLFTIASFDKSPGSMAFESYQFVLPEWTSHYTSLNSLSVTENRYDPYQFESGRTDDSYWNDIQMSLQQHRYVHPVLMIYWAYRVLEWSVSIRAGIATIESLIMTCSLGADTSPDAIFVLLHTLFRVLLNSEKDEKRYWKSADEMQTVLSTELSTQPQLQL